MKAVIQSYRTGDVGVREVPAPVVRPGGILVATAASVVSAGTERAMVELAKKNLLAKALTRPDLVRQVADKARRDGVMATVAVTRDRLEAPVPLGYSSAGIVLEVGDGVRGFRTGQRVACAGTGYACHAEIAYVPQNLAVGLPDSVSLESAAFSTLDAVALHALRLAGIELGMTVAVIGLGVVGLMAVQMAAASGCRVAAFDPDPSRTQLARQLGAERAGTSPSDLTAAVASLAFGRGADAVIVAASSKTSEPVELAGEVARDRAVVVVVGLVGTDVPRDLFYRKELVLRISRSYGPGRYDPEYEERGHDYPPGYVRWTEQRNLEACVHQIALGRVRIEPLISHRFSIDGADEAYRLLLRGDGERPLGIVLTYPGVAELASLPDADHGRADHGRAAAVPVAEPAATAAASLSWRLPPVPTVRIGLIGAGSFATGSLVPALQATPGVTLRAVCTASGHTAANVAERFGFSRAVKSAHDVVNDPEVNTVVIATRHDLHAAYVLAALEAGKHVFCEKPLCLTREELEQIGRAWQAAGATEAGQPILMVGFNRRFAPLTVALRAAFAGVGEPLVVDCRVNAGTVSLHHWVHDPAQGGGRILGEMCHFVDLLAFLTGSEPIRVSAAATPNGGTYQDDNLAALLEFKNGSVGTITYVASGNRLLPKERVEVFGGGVAAVIDNFRRLEVLSGTRRTLTRLKGQDKGIQAEWTALADAIRRGLPSPVPFLQAATTTDATLAVVTALRTGRPQRLTPEAAPIGADPANTSDRAATP